MESYFVADDLAAYLRRLGRTAGDLGDYYCLRRGVYLSLKTYLFSVDRMGGTRILIQKKVSNDVVRTAWAKMSCYGDDDG